MTISLSLMVGAISSPAAIIIFRADKFGNLSCSAKLRSKGKLPIVADFRLLPVYVAESKISRYIISDDAGRGAIFPFAEGIFSVKPVLYFVSSSRSRLKKSAAKKTFVTGRSLFPDNSSEILVFFHRKASAACCWLMLFFRI